jgi:hypothetical protein
MRTSALEVLKAMDHNSSVTMGKRNSIKSRVKTN